MISATAASINDDLKSIFAMDDNLVITWGGEKVSRKPFRNHKDIKLHSKHVIFKENQIVEPPTIQCINIEK